MSVPASYVSIGLLLFLTHGVFGQSNYTINVQTTPKQAFRGFGNSQPSGYALVPDPARSQMTDLVYGSLGGEVLRAWVPTGAAVSVQSMKTDFYARFIDSGLLTAVRQRGVNTILLAPARGESAPTEPLTEYAARLAQFILEVQAERGIRVPVTGIANEPGSWSPQQIADTVKFLRRELNARGLADVKIIAPEHASNDTAFDQRVDAIAADTEAWAGLTGIAAHSYNMAARSQSAARKSTKEFWITESAATGLENPELENDGLACDLAAKFLNDMNHSVDYWIHFIGFANGGSDSATKLMVYDSTSQSVLMHLKFHYFQQLLGTFDHGCVFRECRNGSNSDMTYTYGQKPAVNAAAGINPDGSWGIGIVNNTTGVTTSISQTYPSTDYNVTLNVVDLVSVPSLTCTVFRSRAGQHFVNSGTITLINGSGIIPLASKELVCLRSAATLQPTPPANLGAAASANDVSLRWNSSWSAIDYEVRRAASADGPFSPIATTAGTTLIDATAASGTTYYYRVLANNGFGQSAPTTTAVARHQTPVPEIIIDNADASRVTMVGTWDVRTSYPLYYGVNYFKDSSTAPRSGKSISFTPNLPVVGEYEVFVRWPDAPNNGPTNTPVDVVHAGGASTILCNQKINGATWVRLGLFHFDGSASERVVIRNDGANNEVLADAVRFLKEPEPYGAAPAGVTAQVSNVPGSLASKISLNWNAETHATAYLVKRATSAAGPFAIIAAPTMPGFVDFAVTPEVTYYYQVTAVTPAGQSAPVSAVTAVAWTPTETWRNMHFQTTANSGIAADTADADGDGVLNLVERAIGTVPVGIAHSPPVIGPAGNFLQIHFPRRRDATDITYHVQTSDELTGWSDIWTSVSIPYGGGDAESETVTVTDSVPIGTGKRFMRLQVSRP